MKESGRILIVDDDKNILKTFTTVLRDAGYTVETAENGKEAIQKANANFYNLALIDIRLPDMEGTELLTALPTTTPKMAKVIVTGYPSLQNAVQAVNKGADGYIIKPAKTEDLLRTIREQLRKQQEAEQYSERKFMEFIETRVKKTDNQADSSEKKDR